MLEIRFGESIQIKARGTFLDLNSKYCVQIAELKFINLRLEIEIGNFKTFQLHFEAATKDIFTKIENLENKFNKYLASVSSMSEKYQICLRNNAEIAKELGLKSATIRQQDEKIKGFEKEKTQMQTQFNNLKELNSNSTSEEIIKLKEDVEELQNIIQHLREKLKNKVETSSSLVSEEYRAGTQNRVYKELEISYLKTKEENIELKLKLANFIIN